MVTVFVGNDDIGYIGFFGLCRFVDRGEGLLKEGIVF